MHFILRMLHTQLQRQVRLPETDRPRVPLTVDEAHYVAGSENFVVQTQMPPTEAQQQQTSPVNVLKAQSGKPARASCQTMPGPQRAPSQVTVSTRTTPTILPDRPDNTRDSHHFHNARKVGTTPKTMRD
jgi:hypothetical protein